MSRLRRLSRTFPKDLTVYRSSTMNHARTVVGVLTRLRSAAIRFEKKGSRIRRMEGRPWHFPERDRRHFARLDLKKSLVARSSAMCIERSPTNSDRPNSRVCTRRRFRAHRENANASKNFPAYLKNNLLEGEKLLF